MRSRVESQNAPNRELRPSSRAILPSIRSLKTNAVMNRTPISSSPCGKNTSAPAQTPTVPTNVTVSGLMPHLMKSLTKGMSTTPCQNPLNLSNMCADATGRRCRTVASRGHPGPTSERTHMSDKSPRQGMSKKSGKSLKEKRADKRDKAGGAPAIPVEKNPPGKR